MTQLHGAQSGHHVRTRRGQHLPAGPAERGRDHDHGLEHGREPPGGVPVGDGGQGAWRDRRPCRPAVHPHERDVRRSTSGSAPARTSRSSAASSASSSSTAATSRSTSSTYTNAGVIIDERYGDTEEADGLFSGWDPDKGRYDVTTWQYAGTEVHGAAGQREEGFEARRASRSGRAAAARGCRTASRRRRTRRCSTRAACSRSSGGTTRATRRSSWPTRAGAPSRTSSGTARSCAATPAASAPARSSTRSAGRSTRSASSTSAPPRSSSSSSGTSAAPAAASWRSAATHRSRGRPTSRRSTTSFRATCRCRTPSTTAGSRTTSR